MAATAPTGGGGTVGVEATLHGDDNTDGWRRHRRVEAALGGGVTALLAMSLDEGDAAALRIFWFFLKL
jgi:hypothetical protein